MASRIIRLRRPGACVVCGISIEAGSEAWWDADTKAVTCVACRRAVGQRPNLIESELLDPGRAGASVQREYERRGG